MTQIQGQMTRDANGVPSGWDYVAISAAAPTTTVVKTVPGILHSIVFNKPVSTGVVTIYDAITATGTPIATITSPTGGVPLTLVYDASFTVGLTIVTSTAAQDITVNYI